MGFLLLCVIGLTYIICESEIMSVPRKYVNSKFEFLSSLINCKRCTSFWVGVILIPWAHTCLFPLAAIGFTHIIMWFFELKEDEIKCLL